VSAAEIGALVFAFTFGGATAALWLSAALPAHHLSEASRDTVKIGIGLVATMTALVLGLVTASAKSSFDTLDTQVKHSAANVLALDRVLARYGPESREIREALRDALGQGLEAAWPRDPRPARLDAPEVVQSVERVFGRIRALSPDNDEQRWLKSRAIDLSETLMQGRWVALSSIGSSVPVPFLAMLVFWLTITFTSFGLFAPRNATVVATFFVCALSVAGAIFLILEMDGPFDGLIRISPEPLRFAVARIGR
jgi:hypothetical protein